jgi:thiamine biosynthesis lipoprotein
MRVLSKISITLFAVTILIGFSGCAPKEKPISETQPLLGTEVTITVYDKGQTRESLQPAFDEAFGIMRELEAKILTPGPENELDRVAAAAGNQSVPLSPKLFDLVMDALKLYEETDKIFDIRVKPMMDAYDFDGEPRVPTDAELDSLKQLVAEGGLFVAGKSILLSKKGMGFTLYAIGPGYILDRAAEALAGKGIQSARIQAGHLIRFNGEPPDSRGFELSVVDPDNPDKPLGTQYLPAGGCAMVTCDEGAFEKDGKKYHRLLDPRTGRPADLCTAFAVHANDAAHAQALAVTAFIVGPDDGLKLLDKFAGTTGLVLYEQNGQAVRKGTGPFERLSSL